MNIVKQIGMLVAAVSLASCTAVEKRSPETAALLAALKSLGSQYVLLGHQDATAYGVDWSAEPSKSDVKSTTGAYPAIYGWDLGHLEIGKPANLDNVSFDLMRIRITEAYNRGGINTISWHATNPVNGQSAWDTTQHSIAEILPNGLHHDTYNDYLDRLATFFKSLKTDSGTAIPIIFRPFHEHTGSWFWWGEAFCTPEEYKALWQYTVNYLRNRKELTNLLFAYSSSTIQSEAHYLSRYPGDDYVDILGFDDYCMGDEAAYKERMINSLRILTKIAEERDKVAAITETGYEQIPNPHWFTQVLYPTLQDSPVAWVLLWRNAINRPNHFYAPYPTHPAADDFRKFHQLPDVLFEDGLAPLHIYQPSKP
ncbi:glycoside hydrolase family 26 protein [Parapedobacter sp. 2B3]|uniref:glycoside hydrolase family 26 protein n=1 Tax=Parapedobacter sp. 2B3 TaxID=3342381 RepID=UPI0035B5BAFD